MKIVIAHQTFIDNDAIGHDIIGMYESLKEEGYEVAIYAENYGTGTEKYKPDGIDWNSIITARDNVLIYHHSIYWELGEKLLSGFNGKRIIRYHNVTPSFFFAPYSDKITDCTRKGSEQTKRLARMNGIELFIGASTFNCNALTDYGADPKKVKTVPPFNKIEELEIITADKNMMEKILRNKKVNVLFIGQVFPHKGHVHIINVAQRYRELFDDNITFWIIGSIHPEMGKYMENLQLNIQRFGLEDHIRFMGRVAASVLKSFLLSSTIFLCMSEHEGFCVPLIEAQNFGLPVVAFNSTAVGDTVGADQVLFNELDYDLFASAIFTIANDEAIRDFLIDRGYENYKNRFTNKMVKRSFMKAIESIVRDS